MQASPPKWVCLTGMPTTTPVPAPPAGLAVQAPLAAPPVWPVAAALTLGAGAILAGLGLPPLFEPDEGRYAAIAASFARTGDWVVPHIDGLPFHDKPPGVLWLVALCFELLGKTPAAARLVPALAGVLGLAVTAWLAWLLAARGPALDEPRGGRGGAVLAATLAALALGSAPLWLGASRTLVLDVPLAALVVAGFGLVAHGAGAFDAGIPGGRRRWWARVAGGVVLGLATLAKGPIGVGLAGLGCLAAALVERDRRHALRLLEPTPWLVAVLVAAPWYVAFGLRHPGGLYTFLVEENLQRFVSFHQHPRSAAIYPLTLLWGLAPVLLVAAPLALRAYRGRPSRADLRALVTTAPAPEGRGERTLWAFVLVSLAFFCAASAKLETYMLPLLPPLAALLGAALARGVTDPTRSAALVRPAACLSAGLVALPALLVGGGLVAAELGKDTLVLAADRAPLAALLAVPGALVAAWALHAARRGDARATVSRALAAWIVGSLAAVPIAVAFGEARSAAPVADALRARLTPAHDVVSFGGFVRGLSYYLDEPVIIALDPNEFPRSMFASRPELWLADNDAVRAFLARRRPALLVVQSSDDAGSWRDKALLEQAASIDPPVEVVRRGRYGRFVLYEASPPGSAAPSSP